MQYTPRRFRGDMPPLERAMITIKYTNGADYSESASSSLFNAPASADARTVDIGPGASIAGQSVFGEQFIYVEDGPEFNMQVTPLDMTERGIGIFVDTSDFAYVARITGGHFGDVLRAGKGNDTLNGGLGDDTLEGGSGENALDGGAGKNTLSYEHHVGPGLIVEMASGSANDVLMMSVEDTFSNISNVRGSSSVDTITGDAKDNVIEGGAGGDLLNGGDGRDTLSYEHSVDGVVVSLASNSASGGDAEGDQIELFDNLLGSAMGDSLTGNAKDNVIEGGAGGDLLTGGDGNDTLSYRTSSSGVTVDLTELTASGGDAEGDSFGSFENIIGSTSDDILLGNDGDNTLNGYGGTDSMTGGGGDDRLVIGDAPGMLDGGEGMDYLFVNAGGPVIVKADSFIDIEKVYVRDKALIDLSKIGTGTMLYSRSDVESSATIIGTSGNDRIQGGKGDDVLTGGKGRDSLLAGAGADTFVFKDGDGRDVIRKFDFNVDVIDAHTLASSIDEITFTSFRNNTGTVITFGGESDPSNKIILLDVKVESLTEGNFLF